MMLEEKGITYTRLTGASLAQAVLGRTFCPTSHCSGIDGMVERFGPSGVWRAYGDRWDTDGRYVIENARVVVTSDEHKETFAVYVSADGVIRRAIRDYLGKVRLRDEFSKVKR